MSDNVKKEMINKLWETFENKSKLLDFIKNRAPNLGGVEIEAFAKTMAYKISKDKEKDLYKMVNAGNKENGKK